MTERPAATRALQLPACVPIAVVALASPGRWAGGRRGSPSRLRGSLSDGPGHGGSLASETVRK